MIYQIPYGRSSLPLSLQSAEIKAILRSRPLPAPLATEESLLIQALAHPYGGVTLAEMATGVQNAVILTSDHTRPVPSSKTLPLLLAELRRNNPGISVTVLVASGAHRSDSREELEAMFGQKLLSEERFVIHDARNAEMIDLGVLPSGARLEINRIAAETELLLSDGFIEPHFFAGYSGGRKSVLPGIASLRSIRENHCGRLISNPNARAGILDGNPVHEDMAAAAKLARLRFILNVLLDERHRITAAFAGAPDEAHRAGCTAVAEIACCPVVLSDVVLTSNGGYPLDQNVYQAVKSMATAELCIRPGGAIICVSACEDGIGGVQFENWFRCAESPQAILRSIAETAAADTTADQWQVQILARILAKANVILVCSSELRTRVEAMGLHYASDLYSAIKLARSITGSTEPMVLIPDGVSVFVADPAQ